MILSIIVSIAIYDSYDVYLWHLRGLSMALRMSNYGTYEWQRGNWASSFYHYYYSILIDNLNYLFSCLRVRVYRKGLPRCQVATSERQVVFRVVVEDDAFLIGLHL